MMKKVTLLFIGMAFAACTGPQEVVSSPDGNVQVSVGLTSKGAIQYAVDFNGKEVIGASTLGFDFAEAEDLLDGFELATVDVKEVSDAYTMQWGSNTELSYTHTRQRSTLRMSQRVELWAWYLERQMTVLPSVI